MPEPIITPPEIEPPAFPVGDDAHIVPLPPSKPSEPLPAPPIPLPEPLPEPPPTGAQCAPLQVPPATPVGDAALGVPPTTNTPSAESPTPQPTLAPSPEWEFIQNFTPIKDETTAETIHIFPAPPTIPPPYTEADLDDIHPYPPQAETPWIPHPNPGVLFTDPELCKIKITDARTRACGNDCILLAAPLKEGEPFPLMQIFSLGEVQVIEDKAYLVFRIKDGNPI